MRERVYRDPVHGSIAFDRKKDAYVIDLVDTREFQRLRYIRQLGAAFLVFQGAEHSRFSHSVGTAYLAKKMFNRLRGDPNFPSGIDDDETERAVVAGALLHDIGHGPFSHLFESVFPHKDHEEWGLEIIEDPSTQIHGVLKRHGLVDAVKKILEKVFRPRFAYDIISSQLDADRLDYLLRDSYMTGVAYGRYDLEWLLSVIELAVLPANGPDWGLAINEKKGLHVAEQFVIARHLMYQQVYFHKTIRSAERMVKLIFERLLENAKDGKFPNFCPDPLKRLIDPDPRRMKLDSYLALDDGFVLTCFNAWSHDDKEDDVLRDLSGRLIRRDLFKVAAIDPERPRDDVKYAAAIKNLQEAMEKQGFNPKYYLAFDAAQDFPYKDMTWFVAKEKSPEDIWLAAEGTKKEVLSMLSPLIGSLRNERILINRLCFPKELKAQVREHLQLYLSDRVENGYVVSPRIPASRTRIMEEAPKPKT